MIAVTVMIRLAAVALLDLGAQHEFISLGQIHERGGYFWETRDLI